jgi:hypothetical protein
MNPFVGAAKWAQLGFDVPHKPERESALSLPGASADRAVCADPGQDFVE